MIEFRNLSSDEQLFILSFAFKKTRHNSDIKNFLGWDWSKFFDIRNKLYEIGIACQSECGGRGGGTKIYWFKIIGIE